MHRNEQQKRGDGSDGSAPSESWLFAQAILGHPIPKIVNPETRARQEREELERLAQSSPTHAERLRRLKAADEKARRSRETLEWAAGISTAAEAKLRKLATARSRGARSVAARRRSSPRASEKRGTQASIRTGASRKTAVGGRGPAVQILQRRQIMILLHLSLRFRIRTQQPMSWPLRLVRRRRRFLRQPMILAVPKRPLPPRQIGTYPAMTKVRGWGKRAIARFG